jgi:hypothetical protein
MGWRSFILALVAALLAPATLACSMFTLVRDGAVLMGNNEDEIRPGYVWFTPGGDGIYARINFGFKDKFAQGSMNEKGLCFDAAVVPPVPYTPDPQKETPKNLLEKIMNECATVEEAIEYFGRFNCTHLASAQFMFADSEGNAAVVAFAPAKGLSITRRTGDFLLNTNDRLCTGYRDPRHTLGERELAATTAPPLETAKAVLAAMHQQGKGAFTSYSNIYMPAERSVLVYQLADYSQALTFSFADPPREQPQALDKLFEGGPSVRDLQKAAPRTYDTRLPIAPEDLAAYAGTYHVEEANVDIQATIQGDLLQMEVPDQDPVVAYFEGNDHFRLRDHTGQISFERDPAGKVIAMTLHRAQDGRAVRVAE